MARRRLQLSARPDGDELRARFAQIRSELGVPTDFPPEVLREADVSARRGPEPGEDLRGVAFVTIDPPGSTDLDQALHLERDGDGYRVDYAIADVPGFVDPGGALAAETLRRVQTLYAPDGRTPLHPPVLSEDAASLLPDRDRPAIVWRFRLDATGEVERVDVVRALVRSRRQLDYAGVQERADRAVAARGQSGRDAGDGADLADEVAVLLGEVGRLRQALERARGGANLPLPDQEVEAGPDGYRLRLRPNLPCEEWNAQISLMTGMAAASLMLDGGVGILRTMPAAAPEALAAFRHQAEALGADWPAGQTYGVFLDGLDAARPAHLALLHEAGSLFRGSGYTAFDAAPPAATLHAAVAAPYAHVTAPLRRLVDRFALACCLALAAGRPVPGWVCDGLGALPDRMRAGDSLAGELERRCVEAVGLALMTGREGEVFDAVVIDVAGSNTTGSNTTGAQPSRAGRVQLADPPVLARCEGPVRLGEAVRVRLAPGAPAAGGVRFVPA